MQRSAIRGDPGSLATASPAARPVADFAALHPGYDGVCRGRAVARMQVAQSAASNPIRSIAAPSDPSHAMNASGSLLTFDSRKILPAPSTTQIAELSKTRRFLHTGSLSSLDDAWSGLARPRLFTPSL